MQRDDALKNHIAGHLAGFEPLAMTREGLRRAAVALAIIDEGHGAQVPGLPPLPEWSGAAALLLTRRSSRLRNHAGQWALPGGRMDVGESAEQTALRELNEEVGLNLDTRAVIGHLDDFATRSGFLISPVIVWAGAARQLVPNADEVASIHRIALTEFERADAPVFEYEGLGDQPVLRMPVGTVHRIAAPTAAFIYQFREVCLRGLATRVAHYEQPGFAWK